MTGRDTHMHARVIVRTVILPVIAAAFETYPELDIDEVLALCVPALVEELTFKLTKICGASS